MERVQARTQAASPVPVQPRVPVLAQPQEPVSAQVSEPVPPVRVQERPLGQASARAPEWARRPARAQEPVPAQVRQQA